jgi:hypothetical protein
MADTDIQDLLDAVVSKFASGSCRVCNGKGWLIANPVGMVAKGTKMGRRKAAKAGMHSTSIKPGVKEICACADAGYRRSVTHAVTQPCPRCYAEVYAGVLNKPPIQMFQVGGSGYCSHRPYYLRDFVEACRLRYEEAQRGGRE